MYERKGIYMAYCCPHCGVIHEADVWSAFTDNMFPIMSGLSVYFCPTCQNPTSYPKLITTKVGA